MSERVYVPTTLAALADHVAAGVLPVTDDAVTAPDGSEESEYAALMQAAGASRDLLGGAGRRVVVVAEVASLGDTVPMRDVVAVHADDRDDADEDDDLGWYATQEIPHLLS